MTTPKDSTFKRLFERYMLLVAVGGNGVFYAQAYEIYSKQEAANVSLFAFSISVWALTSWLIYGFILRNRILIVANIVGVLGAVLVVAGILLYS